MSKKKVYIDMDGTLCRFHDTQHNYIEQMWERGFYAGLLPFEEFVNAVSLCIDRNPDTEFYILSAVLDTEPPFIADEKRAWINRYLPQLTEERLIFVPAGADKSQYIGGIDENSVLIDDYNKNLREWEQAGGLPIKFINDVNNKGLGAYGGEKGNIWNGLSIYHNQSAMAICLQLEKCAELTNSDRSNEYYGFNSDVLPEEFVPLIQPYFEMRSTCDAKLRTQLYKTPAVLSDYSSAINTDAQNIADDPLKKEAVSAFAKEHNVNQSMLDCLEICYITAFVNGISADTVVSWLESSVNSGKAFKTYPVTPSNIVTYLGSKMRSEQHINALYGEIKGLQAAYQKVGRLLFMPTMDDVAKNLLTGGKLTATLNDRYNGLNAEIQALSTEWYQETNASYPNVLQGNKERKYVPVSNRNKLNPIK